jgi:hypothetical protein
MTGMTTPRRSAPAQGTTETPAGKAGLTPLSSCRRSQLRDISNNQQLSTPLPNASQAPHWSVQASRTKPSVGSKLRHQVNLEDMPVERATGQPMTCHYADQVNRRFLPSPSLGIFVFYCRLTRHVGIRGSRVQEAADWYCDADRQLRDLDETLERLCLQSVRFQQDLQHRVSLTDSAEQERIWLPAGIYQDDDDSDQ